MENYFKKIERFFFTIFRLSLFFIKKFKEMQINQYRYANLHYIKQKMENCFKKSRDFFKYFLGKNKEYQIN